MDENIINELKGIQSEIVSLELRIQKAIKEHDTHYVYNGCIYRGKDLSQAHEFVGTLRECVDFIGGDPKKYELD